MRAVRLSNKFSSHTLKLPFLHPCGSRMQEINEALFLNTRQPLSLRWGRDSSVKTQVSVVFGAISDADVSTEVGYDAYSHGRVCNWLFQPARHRQRLPKTPIFKLTVSNDVRKRYLIFCLRTRRAASTCQIDLNCLEVVQFLCSKVTEGHCELIDSESYIPVN